MLLHMQKKLQDTQGMGVSLLRKIALLAPCVLLAVAARSRAEEDPPRLLEKAVSEWFAKPDAERRESDLAEAATVYSALIATRPEAARTAVLAGYRAGMRGRAGAFEKRAVTAGKFTMPFTLDRRGTKPKAGWPVFIALHGGGGAPKEVNDDQWRIMQHYYRATDCIYVAPRAPTDAWDGFYTEYVFPLVTELLRGLCAFEEVDPDRIYLLGYSHGGYGAFTIGPKMADRFAAIHADAAAPHGGHTAPENLMNTRFSCLVGEHDSAHNRLAFCKQFEEAVKKLKGERADVWPVTVEVAPGKQHSELGDHDRPAAMASSTRTAVPRSLRWKLTDGVITEFAWLRVSAPGGGQEVIATCKDNRVELTTHGVASLDLRLDQRLVDRSKPIVVIANGQTVFEGTVAPDLRVLCRTLAERGDPVLAFDSEVALQLEAQ
jgi:predicted esterase